MTEFDKALTVLQNSDTAANAHTAPLWLSVLALVVFGVWAVWYLDKKLSEESKRSGK